MTDTPPARISPHDLRFPFSDTIAGYVREYRPGSPALLTVCTADDRLLPLVLDDGTAAEHLRNLGEPYADASADLADLLVPGRFVFAYGIYYPEAAGVEFKATNLVVTGRRADDPADSDWSFEDPGWWIAQIDQLAGFYRRAQFGDGDIDYADYRTMLRLGGDRSTTDFVQETDTISRMVYGMASAFMLTGNQDYLEVAERGTEYLRAHMRFVDGDENVTYWYHGIKIEGSSERKLFTSEFDDDYDAVPMYEQIYALAGLTQTFRVTGDRRIADDIDATLRLFEKFFRDHENGGYYSHIDPITLSPHAESLGANVGRKNWNSVGDHAPAYLINLFLATGEERHADMLARTFDTIVTRFPDEEHSPFVNERFHDDWSHDLDHGWQQDRAVVGHNLKIAWNLTRMQQLRPRAEYGELARRLAERMPAVGSDLQRGGWYDVVERTLAPDQEWYRFAWHDRKAWWQQEQAMLAYLILAGVERATGEEGDGELLRQARQAQAFYNAFFLDHDEGGVYFNVLASGVPYLLGTERLKGSHSMSMYHTAELCYLAATYIHLLVAGHPLTLWFAPLPEADRTLRVSPDLLPPRSVRLTEVEIDGKPHEEFDATALTVDLPPSDGRLIVRVTLEPATPGPVAQGEGGR
jgi:mannose/cellobiose epimerase-like protein (N-acyl-D-glucosamine 2-epimerase family)